MEFFIERFFATFFSIIHDSEQIATGIFREIIPFFSCISPYLNHSLFYGKMVENPPNFFSDCSSVSSAQKFSPAQARFP